MGKDTVCQAATMTHKKSRSTSTKISDCFFFMKKIIHVDKEILSRDISHDEARSKLQI